MENLFSNVFVVPILGFAVGLVGTIIGAGGGFFVIPYLLVVFSFEPPRASGTSLWLVLANSISSTLRNARFAGRIDYRMGLTLAAFTIPTAILGAKLVKSVPLGPYQLAFAGLMIGAAIYAAIPVREDESSPRTKQHLVIGAIVSVGTGLIASMFGVGGGLIHVPLMMFGFGMSAISSTATSHLALIFTSGVAAAAYALDGQVDWTMVALLAPGVVAGSQVGVWASARVSRVTVRRVLAVVFIVVAAELAFNSGVFK